MDCYLCPIILEKLPNDLRLIISRNNNENNWNFTKTLDLINVNYKPGKHALYHHIPRLRVRMILDLAVHLILHILVHR